MTVVKQAVPRGFLINLLPEEILIQRRHSYKIVLINRVSIAFLVVILIAAAFSLVLKINQANNLKRSEEEYTTAKDKIMGLQSKEADLLILKNRLSTIQSSLGADTKRKAVFNLVTSLSSGMQINDLTVDKNSNMTISLSTASAVEIEKLLFDLSSKERNSDLISKIDLGGLSLGKDNIFRFNLKIIPK